MSPSPAVFGKAPAHGDFVVRGLDPSTRAAWDRFASDGLEEARRAFGDGFDAAHEGAPPLAFVLGPETGLSRGWAVGVMAPSVDRVGRRFILVVTAEGLTGPDAERYGAALAEALGEVALSAFTRTRDADGLLADAQAVMAGFELDPGEGWPMEGVADRWWPLGSPADDLGAATGPHAIGRMLDLGAQGGAA